MATSDQLLNIVGGLFNRFQPIAGSSKLSRGAYFTNSNSYQALGGRYGNQQDCDAQGLGFTFNSQRGSCYFPCPDSYLVDSDDVSKCDPRPILTKADIYYGILANEVTNCAKLIPAYRDLVAENDNDPTKVGFPEGSGCENPFPSPPVFPFDPVGVYDSNASNGDPTRPEDVAPDDLRPTTQPSTPLMADKDASGLSKTLPRDRIVITTTEVDLLKKVNDFGVNTYSSLALRLQAEPTFLDTNPSYLLEVEKVISGFKWEITITPNEYAQLLEEDQCALCMNYGTLYTDPSQIKRLRLYAPTITMTRNAPSPNFPTFGECPQAKKETACAQKQENGGFCRWVGDCSGNCKCPEASSKEGTVGGGGSSGGSGDGEIALKGFGVDTQTLLLIGGGLAVAYYLFK